MFTKFTDAIKWLVNWINNSLPEIGARIAGDAERAVTSAADAAGSASAAAGSATAAANSAAAAKLKATTTTDGVVRITTDQEVAAGATSPLPANAVPTGAQMRAISRAMEQITASGIPDATETIKGKAKIAGADAARDKMNDTDMVTPKKAYMILDTLPDAGPDVRGLVRPATDNECVNAVDTAKYITPAGLRAAFAPSGRFGWCHYVRDTDPNPYTSMDQFRTGGNYYLGSESNKVTDRPFAGTFYLIVLRSGEGMLAEPYNLQFAVQAGAAVNIRWRRYTSGTGVWSEWLPLPSRYATAAQATAGTDDELVMTPLKVKNAIDNTLPAADKWKIISTAVGANAVLPAGGTWAYYLWLYMSSTGAVSGDPVAGVAAGGTNVRYGDTGYKITGFCWKIA